jgi:hypothetical protein
MAMFNQIDRINLALLTYVLCILGYLPTYIPNIYLFTYLNMSYIFTYHLRTYVLPTYYLPNLPIYFLS